MKNSINILILGGGIMQLPAIRIAKRKGWKVFLADADSKAPGIDIADEFVNVDLKDRDGMLKAARNIRIKNGLDGIFTAGTDFSTTVAWVAEKMNLPGIPYDVAAAATDKSRMRSVFKDNNVPSPAFLYVKKDDNLQKVTEVLDFPLVVKPVDNMGARGVRRVNNGYELKNAVDDAYKNSRSGKVIIESYITGPELSLDAIVYKGRITVCGIADRHICFPPYFVEMGHTMPSVMGRKYLKEAVDVFKRGVKAIGIDNGAAKGDIKISSGGAVVGEIAARLSGGYMSGWTFPYSSGIEVTEAALNIAAGLKPGNLKPVRSMVSAERAFISIPGKVKEIYGTEEARAVKGIQDLFMRISIGSIVRFPTNNVEKCGNVISLGADHDDAVNSAEAAVRKIFILLEPEDSRTESFLFPLKEQTFYLNTYAYRLERKNNRDAAANIKSFKFAEGRETDWNGTVNVVMLSEIEEERCCDWHGSGIQYILKKIPDIAGIRFISSFAAAEKNSFVLGSLFWKAFLKGGFQGGMYIIDTVKQLLKNRQSIRNYFNRVSL
ncbi:MAG: ATP-grasp domain-containing protein [Spirochaetes bacterium]|nr:ATP-grasp domain-containing protein [Spirochaetota bacterium]